LWIRYLELGTVLSKELPLGFYSTTQPANLLTHAASTFELFAQGKYRPVPSASDLGIYKFAIFVFTVCTRHAQKGVCLHPRDT